MLLLSRKQRSFILKASCPAKDGIEKSVESFFEKNGCHILSKRLFEDKLRGGFFIRTVFSPERGEKEIEKIRGGFSRIIAAKFGMEWGMYDPLKPFRVMIMVSKLDHCLRDLLYRCQTGRLSMEITAVVSNHNDLREYVENREIKYIHLPVNKETRPQQEAKLLKIIEETETELVVLARYMQIFSAGTVEKLYGKCINIHHSLLPAFKGPKAYNQAYEYGVKVVGATAHYVTEELDEGPIIEQQPTRVDHTKMPEDLKRTEKENEQQALAKAVRYHIEHRIFIDGRRTVIL